jgi:uncharacterized membrane protein
MATQVTLSTPAPVARPAAARPERLDSIDLLRGAVIVLMALDHVRDFWSDRMFMNPVDLDTTTPAIFLTRWVTHFCAPVFIFLAGTGAYLSGSRGKSKAELSWFLFTRGLWLAFFEVVINRMMWMFNFDLLHHGAGVFWAIGWSMVVLAVLVYLPTWFVTLFGVAMVALHNLLDPLGAEQVRVPDWLWTILHQPGDNPVVSIPDWLWLALCKPEDAGPAGDVTFGTGYCVIPWAGVMAAGYGFGALMVLPQRARRRWTLLLGAGLTLGFIVLRAVNVYGDPSPWMKQPDGLRLFLSFLNCTKYPPSLLYLLMTLGPAILALALFDRPPAARRGGVGALWERLTRPVVTFGRVPLFFYLLHIPLIHGGAVLCDYLRFGWSPQATDGPWAVQPGQIPEGYGVSLPVVYLVWVAVLLILYFPCRWFADLKRRRRDAWLSYF